MHDEPYIELPASAGESPAFIRRLQMRRSIEVPRFYDLLYPASPKDTRGDVIAAPASAHMVTSLFWSDSSSYTTGCLREEVCPMELA